MKLELRAQQQPWHVGISFLLTQHISETRIGVARVQIEAVDVDRADLVSTFSMSQTEAQVLMDDLWNCGLRPSEGAGSAGSLRATEKHLSDMRKLVSSKLKVDL